MEKLSGNDAKSEYIFLFQFLRDVELALWSCGHVLKDKDQGVEAEGVGKGGKRGRDCVSDYSNMLFLKH